MLAGKSLSFDSVDLGQNSAPMMPRERKYATDQKIRIELMVPRDKKTRN